MTVLPDRNIILEENKKRRSILFCPYNPITGEGSPLERMKISYFADGKLWSYAIPLPMYEENKDLIDLLTGLGNVEEVLKQADEVISLNNFLVGFTDLRFKYDFEFWAYTCVKIQDKKSKLIIPFKLNRPQRRVLARLEKMRIAGVPIRAIILKARQWGGSTLVQVYMAWIQLIHKKNWHSAIIAQVENQARNIRGMYSRLAKEYPSSMGKVKFLPFEGSSKNKVIEGRDCIIGIGSAEEPDSLRSFDFAMAHMCLAPGTLVPTADGILKKVEDLVVGDDVITHTGTKTKITTITKSVPSEYNGNGKAITINPWLSSSITLTPNHPVWTKRGWVEAGELSKNDLVSMPVRKITNEISSITLPVTATRIRGGGKKAKASGKNIPLDKEIGFAFGYYLAEGSLHDSKAGRNEIDFARHDNEIAFGDRAVKALLPYISSHTRKKKPDTQTTHEHLYSTVLARWIELELGTKENKKIPDWFFKCGKDFLEGVLQGYLSGDGSKTNDKQGNYQLAGIRATTISSSIAIQIRDLAASLGLGWGAIDIKDAGVKYRRNCQEAFNVRWSGSAARNIRLLLGQEFPDNGHLYSEKAKISDGQVWIKLRDLKNSRVQLVYDIEVDHPDHSFRTIAFSVKNSEAGLWKSTPQKSAEDLVQGVRAGIPDVPYSLEVLESTAKGVGNFFHREWLAAEGGTSSYDPIFVPWFEIELYQKPITNMQKFLAFFETNDYAQVLWNLGATLEGINWYFDFKIGKNYDDWRMKSEFPSTALEAFQSTGRRVFAQSYVQNARKHCLPPMAYGDIFAKSQKGKDAFENLEFQQNDKGLLLIWGLPDKSIEVSDRYLVTVDIGGRTDKADWSVIKVLDRYWMSEGGKPEVIACWRGHLDQDLVSWKAAQIAKFYNNALLVVESNSLDTEESEGNHFLTVLDEIVSFYPNIYARMDPEQVRLKLPVKYGFQTNKATKPMVIDMMNGSLRDEEYYERDLRACDEMDTYEIKPNGTYGAVDGCKDDMVMTTAIMLWICFQYMAMPKLIVKATGSLNKKIVSEASI